MLPKKKRLSRREIEELKAQKSKILQGQFFGLIVQTKTKEESPSIENKFGVIISNSISKKATERNRIKRLLFLAIQESGFGKSGKYLFLAKRNCVNISLEDIKRELITLTKKLSSNL